jgi:drug/metabolite transporter (DMT)-like permease
LLWSTLATFGVALAHLPPLFLTGCALTIGALPGVTHFRQWRVPATTLLLGIGGLFGFHFLLFMALRYAPPVEANLVNYLWPLLIVLLTPLLLPGWRLRRHHVIAAAIGFAGAALAIGAAPTTFTPAFTLGFAFAAGSALVWACYSLLTRRVAPFSSWAIGGFALASGLLALACHVLFEAPAELRDGDAWLLLLLGLGPMGGAFISGHRDEARRFVSSGSTCDAAPATALLVVATGRPLTWALAAATVLVVAAAVLASRAPRH